jgi:hypothetical protein
MQKNALTGHKGRKRFVVVAFATIVLVGLFYLQPAVRPVSAQQSSTSSFSDDFSADSKSWQYLGHSYRDTTNQYLVLTENVDGQGGAVFLNVPVQGPFTASFRYKAGGGILNGDGFCMFFYKQKFDLIGTGGSLGFSPYHLAVPGYGVEFDGFQNSVTDAPASVDAPMNPSNGDPSASHIALIKDATINHLVYVNDSRASDYNWHNVTVNVEASSIEVYVDQDLALQWSGEFDRTYNGFGFGGGTGHATGWHIIDDFSISSISLTIPTLTTFCVSSMSQSSFKVKINGDLTANGAPIPDATLLLSYSVTRGDSWQDLTSVHTSSDGSYSALWLVPVTGDYMLKAVYRGNGDHLGTSNIVNFSIEPCNEYSVFSVTSNSTLSELSFNSANKELNFKVSGDPDTTGYVSVYIPETVLTDISGLKVYLDSNQVQYTVQPQSEGWLLFITYHHSTHTFTVNLGSSTANPTIPPTGTPSTSQARALDLDIVKIAILLFMGTIAAVVIVALVFYMKDKNQQDS